jgi:YaeQ protein.
VYSFNTKSDVWWAQESKHIDALKVHVRRFERAGIESLAAKLQRTMEISVTISGDSAFVATADGECEVNWLNLQ